MSGFVNGRINPLLQLACAFFSLLFIQIISASEVGESTKQFTGPNHLRIASARSAKDLKIIDALAEQFRSRYPQVTISIQSDAVLKVLDDGRDGLADVILTHHKPGELHFVKEGYALRHSQIMYTEYALFGPVGDPLQLSKEKDIVAAFKRLAEKEAEFHVPSPRSGTHMKIAEIWTMAGINPDWIGYENTGGSGYATLLQASEFGVYTVAEMATYLDNKDKLEGSIIPLFRDDLDLRNVYSLIVVNPEKVPGVNSTLALAFHDYLVSEDGQNFIRQFGEEQFHATVLTPAAHLDPQLQEWRVRQTLEVQSKELKLAIASSIALFLLLVTSVFLFLRMRVIERMHIESEARNEALEMAREEILRANQLLQQEIEERKLTETRLSDAIQALNASEEELRKYHDHLEMLVQSRTRELESAVQELQAFSYSVSHDLRTPLRSINGFSRLIMEECQGSLDETGRDYLKRIVNASVRMDSLIDGLLQLSRISRQELKYETVNISDLAKDVLDDLCAASAERNVVVEIEGDLIANCDENLLRIVLHNLVSNALKYSARNQQACVSIGKTCSRSGEYFYVKDNGVGFNMKFSNKLFKPFQRLHSDEQYAGSGIGLSTVQRIIHRHGGAIWAESAPGQGATFYFTLSPVQTRIAPVFNALPN